MSESENTVLGIIGLDDIERVEQLEAIKTMFRQLQFEDVDSTTALLRYLHDVLDPHGFEQTAVFVGNLLIQALRNEIRNIEQKVRTMTEEEATKALRVVEASKLLLDWYLNDPTRTERCAGNLRYDA